MRKIKVGAILHNEKGNLLLQLRDEEPEKGKWVLFGGEAKKGESNKQTCLREIKEELNYNINKCHFFKKYKDKKIELPVFIVDDCVNINMLTLREGDDFKFFSADKLDKIKIGFNQKKILFDYINNPQFPKN